MGGITKGLKSSLMDIMLLLFLRFFLPFLTLKGIAVSLAFAIEFGKAIGQATIISILSFLVPCLMCGFLGIITLVFGNRPDVAFYLFLLSGFFLFISAIFFLWALLAPEFVEEELGHLGPCMLKAFTTDPSLDWVTVSIILTVFQAVTFLIAMDEQDETLMRLLGYMLVLEVIAALIGTSAGTEVLGPEPRWLSALHATAPWAYYALGPIRLLMHLTYAAVALGVVPKVAFTGIPTLIAMGWIFTAVELPAGLALARGWIPWGQEEQAPPELLVLSDLHFTA